MVDYVIERVSPWEVETCDSSEKVLKNSRHRIFERRKSHKFRKIKNKILVDWVRDEGETKKKTVRITRTVSMKEKRKK